MENLISFGNGLLIYMSIGCVLLMLKINSIDNLLKEENEKEDSYVDMESDWFKLIIYSIVVVFWLPMLLWRPSK